MSENIDLKRKEIQQEAFERAQKADFNCSLLLPTGTGKTACMLQILRFLYDRGLVNRSIYTCDNTRLRDTDFPQEMIKWGCEDLMPHVERLCYQSAYKIAGEEYDLWLADEADYFLKGTGEKGQYIKFFENNGFKYKILVTGTLDDSKRPILNRIAPIVYEKKTWELEQAGVLNKTRYYMVNYLLSDEESAIYRQYNRKFAELLADTQRYKKQLEFLKLERKHFLASLDSSYKICRQIISKIYTPASRILIFSQSQAQIDRILPYTYHTANQKENWLEKFDNGEVNALGVVGKVDRGANLNGVNTVIFEAPGSSATRFGQRLGRSKRLKQDQFVDTYFLIPYYTTDRGEQRETIVKSWVEKSMVNVDRSFIQDFQL